MKNTKFNLIKLGIILFGISLLLWNCENENVHQEENLIQSRLKVSYVSTSEINLNNKLAQKLSTLSKIKNTLSRDVYSSEHNFTINTDLAKYIENSDGSYHSYTFKIIREEDNGFLENLLVSLQSDGSYKLFLIRYDLTEEEKNIINNGGFLDIANKFNSNEITEDGLVEQILSRGEGCEQIYYEPCDNGGNADGHAPIEGVCNGSPLIINIAACGGAGVDVSPGNSSTDGTGSNEGAGNNSGAGSVGDGQDEQFPDTSTPLVCGQGYELYNGSCVPICARNSTRNFNNGNCDCDSGYTPDDEGNCVNVEEYYEALLEDGIVVIDPLEGKKVDPEEELKCFDLTKEAKLTVYVQQPRENSDAVIGPNSVGHAFIGIEQNGVKRMIGYYPESGANSAFVAVGVNYSAEIRSNYDYLYHVSISQDITGDQLSDIVDYAKIFPPTYNVSNYACADFAIAIGNLGGMNLPSTTVSNITFSGRSPGKLGQEIRAMNSTSSTTISTTSSNSPSKQGGC